MAIKTASKEGLRHQQVRIMRRSFVLDLAAQQAGEPSRRPAEASQPSVKEKRSGNV